MQSLDFCRCQIDSMSDLSSAKPSSPPAMGHLKSDHRLDRCWLRGEIGDALHAISCAASYNLRWLLRAVAPLGIGPFLRLLHLKKPPLASYCTYSTR